jgi:hypothetical protein
MAKGNTSFSATRKKRSTNWARGIQRRTRTSVFRPMMTVWSCRSESGVCMMRKKVRLYCRKRRMRNLRSILNLRRPTIEHIAPQPLKEGGAYQSASTQHTIHLEWTFGLAAAVFSYGHPITPGLPSFYQGTLQPQRALHDNAIAVSDLFRRFISKSVGAPIFYHSTHDSRFTTTGIHTTTKQ